MAGDDDTAAKPVARTPDTDHMPGPASGPDTGPDPGPDTGPGPVTDTPSAPGPLLPALAKSLAAVTLLLAPAALTSALLYRAGLDWAHCLATAEGTAPPFTPPGLLAPEMLAHFLPDRLLIVALTVLAVAGPTVLTFLPRRRWLGLVGWALVMTALWVLLGNPTATHACDRSGVTAEVRLVFLPLIGWGYTLGAALFTRARTPPQTP